MFGCLYYNNMADGAGGCSTKVERSFNNSNKYNNKNHIIRKRPPKKEEHAANVVYVCTKSNLNSLIERCSKLIHENHNEIIINCLGAAIPRGILLSLQLCEKHLAFQVAANTLTTQLIDDLEPATDEADYEIQRRQNSALRIRIFRRDLLTAEPCSSQ